MSGGIYQAEVNTHMCEQYLQKDKPHGIQLRFKNFFTVVPKWMPFKLYFYISKSCCVLAVILNVLIRVLQELKRAPLSTSGIFWLTVPPYRFYFL